MSCSFVVMRLCQSWNTLKAQADLFRPADESSYSQSIFYSFFCLYCLVSVCDLVSMYSIYAYFVSLYFFCRLLPLLSTGSAAFVQSLSLFGGQFF